MSGQPSTPPTSHDQPKPSTFPCLWHAHMQRRCFMGNRSNVCSIPSTSLTDLSHGLKTNAQRNMATKSSAERAPKTILIDQINHCVFQHQAKQLSAQKTKNVYSNGCMCNSSNFHVCSTVRCNKSMTGLKNSKVS